MPVKHALPLALFCAPLLLAGCGGGSGSRQAAEPEPVDLPAGKPAAPGLEVVRLRPLVGEPILAFDLNDQGAVAGRLGAQAVLWHPQQGLRRLEAPAGAEAATAVALNGSGRAVGYADYPSEAFGWPTVALIWDADGALAARGQDLHASEATAIDGRGRVAGLYASPPGRRRVFTWEPSGFVDQGEQEGEVLAVMRGEDGSVVITSWGEGGYRVRIRRPAGEQRLSDAYVSALAADGRLGGCRGADWQSSEPAVWSPDGRLQALDAQGRQGCVDALGDEGSAAGWYRRADGSVGQFLYRDGRFEDLEALLGGDYGLQRVQAINAVGEILVELVGGEPLLLRPVLPGT